MAVVMRNAELRITKTAPLRVGGLARDQPREMNESLFCVVCFLILVILVDPSC